MRTRNSLIVPVLFEALETRVLLSAAAATVHHPNLHHAAAHVVHQKVVHHKVTAAHHKTAAAGDPIYMNWNSQSIPGDVTDVGFAGDILLNSVSWGLGKGVTSAMGSAAGGSRQNSVSSLTITKTLDKSTPKLLDQALGGTPTPEVDILFSSGGTQPYLQYTLKNVLISGYSVSSGGDRPTESMTLDFTQVQISYFSQNASGQTVPITSQLWSINPIVTLQG